MFVKFKIIFFKRLLVTGLTCFITIAISSFNRYDIHDLTMQTQLKLNALYDQEYDALKAKKIEILVTDDGFLRYRKTFLAGKQEYYSFNLRQLNSVNYLGNSTKGDLLLKTLGEDVIVQTYNDPKGDIDSMAGAINLNVKLIEPEDLNLIQNNLMQIRKMLVTK